MKKLLYSIQQGKKKKILFFWVSYGCESMPYLCIEIMEGRNRNEFCLWDWHVENFLRECLTIKEELGRYAHKLANRKTPEDLKSCFYEWRQEAPWDHSLFAPQTGQPGKMEIDESDSSLIAIAWRMICPSASFYEYEDEEIDRKLQEFGNYLRRLYHAEQNIYNGHPIGVYRLKEDDCFCDGIYILVREMSVTYSRNTKTKVESWQVSVWTSKINSNNDERKRHNLAKVIIDDRSFMELIEKVSIISGKQELFNELTK